jgi:hypothetical protein
MGVSEVAKEKIENYPKHINPSSIPQILSHRSSRRLQIYVFPWIPGAMLKEDSPQGRARRKSPTDKADVR